MTFDLAPGNVQLVSVGSVLTLEDARALGPVLERSLPANSGNVVLDLSGTSLAARPAIVVALRELRRLVRRRGRRAIVVAPDDHRHTVLTAARFDDVMLLAPSLEAAMERAGRSVHRV
jgi:hypothetical protein